MLNGKLFPVILTYKGNLPVCPGKIPLQPEVPFPAAKPHHTGIISRIVPRFIPCKIILHRRAASPPLKPEEHRADKRMDRRFPELVLPADHLQAVVEIEMLF